MGGGPLFNYLDELLGVPEVPQRDPRFFENSEPCQIYILLYANGSLFQNRFCSIHVWWVPYSTTWMSFWEFQKFLQEIPDFSRTVNPARSTFYFMQMDHFFRINFVRSMGDHSLLFGLFIPLASPNSLHPLVMAYRCRTNRK